MNARLIKFFSLLTALFMLGCSPREKILTAEEIYSKISPSTVEVHAENNDISSLGTGFYIDSNGTVVTNYHVIEGCSIASIMTSDGGAYDVIHVLGYSKNLDVAILSTSRRNSIGIETASTPVATGESVFALGSSMGLTGTFSEGMVSSAERVVDGITYIQITTPISQGNSGGPLVNSKGQAVGITSAGFLEGQNLNLALPISVLDQISSDNPITMEEFYEASTAFIAPAPSSDSICVGVRTISLNDKLTADFILGLWESGDATEKSMIQIMDEYGASQGGGQLYLVEPGIFVEEIDTWCFDPNRQVGDVAIIENIYGYSICYISSVG